MKKIIFIAIAIIILTASIAARSFLSSLFSPLWKRGGGGDLSAEASAPKTGLVGWWTMDTNDMSATGATAYDKSGQNTHGTVTGTTTSTGRIGQSRSFNGTSDGISITAPQWRNNVISAFAWIKSDALGARDDIIGSGNSGAYATNNWILSIGSTNVITVFGDTVNKAGNTAIKAGKWHHIGFVNDGSNTTIYLDGAVDAAAAAQTINNNDTSGEYIAGKYATLYFGGSVDDVRIYNRALSAAEVTQLYNSTNINRENTAVKDSSTVSSDKRLVGYWTMDAGDTSGNKIFDRSGNNYNGTASYSNTPTSTAGKIKQAISFNLIPTQNLYFSFGDVLDMDQTDQLTISAWVNTTTTAYAFPMMILMKWDAGLGCASNDGEGYYLATKSSGVLRASVNSDDGSNNLLDGTRAINDGRWHHVVVTAADGANNYKFYVDGTIDTTATKSGTGIHNTPTALTTGLGDALCSGEANRLSHGNVDELRLYNYAMSAQEVANLYNSAKVNFVNTPTKTGLVGYWNMDNSDRSGNLIYDRSGFNNNGTLTGTATSTGIIKQARSFNGSSDYIEMGDVLDMDATDEVTLSAWIKTTHNSANRRGIIYKWDAGAGCASDAGQSYGMNVSNGVLETGVNSDNGTDNGVAGSFRVDDGKWHHVVFSVKDGTNNYNQYIDGVNSFQGTKSGTGIKNSPTAFRVGVGEILCYGLSNVVFNGQIDEARVYNRALSAQEVANLYNSAKATFVR